MARIAIIDDVIHENHLPRARVTERFRLTGQGFHPADAARKDGYTHGTLVAMVLEQYAADYEIVNVQMLDNWLETPRLPVRALVRALDFCLSARVDLVSVSLGSERLSEMRAMSGALAALRRRGIPVVAAYSNASVKTIPAACDGVIGVKADHGHALADGRYGFVRDPYAGDAFLAHYGFTLAESRGKPPCNSLAVSVMTAQVNRILNRQTVDAQVLMELLMRQADACLPPAPPAQTTPNDIVPVLYCVDVFTENREKQLALLDAFAENGYEAVALSGMAAAPDVRITPVTRWTKRAVGQARQALSLYTKSDLLLVFLSAAEFDALAPDGEAAVVCRDASALRRPWLRSAQIVEASPYSGADEICGLLLQRLAPKT